jgi:hypothetical protein
VKRAANRGARHELGRGHKECYAGVLFARIEHGPWSSRNFDDVLQMLAVSSTHWDPTLAVHGGDSLLLRDEPEQLTDAKFTRCTPASYIDFARSSGYYNAVSNDALRGNFSASFASVKRAHQLGVRLLIGSDAPNPDVFYGSSLQVGIGVLRSGRASTTGSSPFGQ